MSNVIITHDGNFHLDEILAISILQKIYPHAEIVRTRDYSLIEDYLNRNEVLAIVDVYGKYDGVTFFDHHQHGFDKSIDLLCSSAGLIFLRYGDDLFKNYTEDQKEILKNEMYQNYIKFVDALDNGIDVRSFVNENEPIYIRSISTVVADCPTFEEALRIVKNDLDNYINSLERWFRDYEIVYNKINKLNPEHNILYTYKLGNISRLVCAIEKKLNRDIKFVINSNNSIFSIYAVPESLYSFKTKIPLCKDWRGLRDDELIRESGIDGCVYVHSTGFLGINKTKEGALEMCKRAMRE